MGLVLGGRLDQAADGLTDCLGARAAGMSARPSVEALEQRFRKPCRDELVCCIGLAWPAAQRVSGFAFVDVGHVFLLPLFIVYGILTFSRLAKGIAAMAGADNGRRFTIGVKRAAWRRCGGQCDGCTAPLVDGGIVYDHVEPWELSRDSSVENCQVLCKTCDAIKTYRIDAPMLAKVDRQHDRAIGAAGPGHGRRPLPCGRRSRWRKKLSGEVEQRRVRWNG
jgi:5-methylcytosine-specific restriction enzyme A